jgi:hypothetical protein
MKGVVAHVEDVEIRIGRKARESVATVVEVGDNGMLKEFSAERDAPGRFDLICR